MFSLYKGKTVLVTGHTGFKGSWLSVWLNQLGARVVGISDKLPTDPCNFEVSDLGDCVADNRLDVRDAMMVREAIERIQPDFVFHLAAQALVRLSYDDPLKTMQTNALGTANLLDALRAANKPVVAVMITSDKAYDNVEWVWGYRETDKVGGKDPYSASKGMAELAIRSFVESYFAAGDCPVSIGIARAGNVIGGGDWAADRIVPDCMKAWSAEESVDIRSPNATRPWQHVLEPLSGYLTLGAALAKNSALHGEAYNFGPASHNNQTVADLIDSMATHWDNVRWRDTSSETQEYHEAGLLRLNCDKALLQLGWKPTLEFDDTVEMTVSWYKEFYRNSDQSMFEFTVNQIARYTELAKRHNQVWI